MNASAVERPDFFEGQYLGAADLDLAVAYARDAGRRHVLGGHTWGIAAGLELRTVASGVGGVGGQVQVVLTPGYAWDGYGRAIVVPRPYPLRPDLFARENTGVVHVWLRYAQRRRESARRGYEACQEEDRYARVDESFEVVAQRPSAVTDRQSGVFVGGRLVEDARNAYVEMDDESGVVCDGSVPHQVFPADDEEAQWLVPVGVVNWDADTGTFNELTKSNRQHARIFRRQSGVVAEGIYAAGGVLRLRGRQNSTADGESAEERCGAEAIKGTDFKDQDGLPQFKELVWVEGNMRVTGHARLFGTRLELRNEHGTDDGVPLFIRRALEGGVLRVGIGTEDGAAGDHMLAIGTSDADYRNFESKVVVTDQGRLGIGTAKPTVPLHVSTGTPATLSDGSGHLLVGEETQGNLVIGTSNIQARSTGVATALRLQWEGGDLSVHKEETERFQVMDDGRVGVRTHAPAVSLHVARGNDGSAAAGADGLLTDEEACALIESDGIPSMVAAWEASLTASAGGDLLADGAGHLLLGSLVGPNVVFDNHTIQARDAGSAAQLRLQWEGGALAVHQNPSQRFQVTGAGDVGIGTSSPGAKLEVRGDIRLWDDKHYAIGSREQSLRVVAGRVNLSGNPIGGTGFKSGATPKNTGDWGKVYEIEFVPEFASVPVVVVCADGGNDTEDNIANTYAVTRKGFKVSIYDSNREGNVKYETSPFNFIAIGARS